MPKLIFPSKPFLFPSLNKDAAYNLEMSTRGLGGASRRILPGRPSLHTSIDGTGQDPRPISRVWSYYRSGTRKFCFRFCMLATCSKQTTQTRSIGELAYCSLRIQNTILQKSLLCWYEKISTRLYSLGVGRFLCRWSFVIRFASKITSKDPTTRFFSSWCGVESW